jgi:hypothetical protein
MDLLYQSMHDNMPIVCFMTKVETNMLSWMDFTDTIMLRYKNIFERENGVTRISN